MVHTLANNGVKALRLFYFKCQKTFPKYRFCKHNKANKVIFGSRFFSGEHNYAPHAKHQRKFFATHLSVQCVF